MKAYIAEKQARLGITGSQIMVIIIIRIQGSLSTLNSIIVGFEMVKNFKVVLGFLAFATVCVAAVTASSGGSGSSGAGVTTEDSTEYYPYTPTEEMEEVDWQLNMNVLTPDRIEGVFFNKENRSASIYFISASHPNMVELSVSTFAGETFISSQHYSQGMLLTVLGKQFLVLNVSTTEVAGYFVPPEYLHEAVDGLLYSNTSCETLELFNATETNLTRQSSYDEMLVRPEIDMIYNAAYTLGKNGIGGTEYPSAFSFYLLALRLSNIRRQEFPELDTLNDTEEADFQTRTKRNHCWVQTHCNNNGKCCSKCPKGPNCVGMCGPKCKCWPWACGHCCFNNFCNGHDLCCAKNPRSWGCLVPLQGAFNFATFFASCNIDYWCYSDADINECPFL